MVKVSKHILKAFSLKVIFVKWVSFFTPQSVVEKFWLRGDFGACRRLRPCSWQTWLIKPCVAFVARIGW